MKLNGEVWELSPLHKLATDMFDETNGTEPIMDLAYFNRNGQDYCATLIIEQDSYQKHWFKRDVGTILWRISETTHIPLGRFAPTVLGWMIDGVPKRDNDV